MKWIDLEWYYCCRHQIHSAFCHFVDSSSVFLLLRLEFSRTQHHVTAQVFSSSSPAPVLSCSTKEWALKKELASTRCVAACQAVGEVLAQRCQQAGITRIVYRAIPWTYRSDAVSLLQRQWLECIFPFFFFYPLIVFFNRPQVQSFRKAMKDGGITLSEPRRKYIGTWIQMSYQVCCLENFRFVPSSHFFCDLTPVLM